MTANETFDYSSVPFQQNVDQIRLLSIQNQDTAGERVRCKLEVFDLASPPPYAALSYVWGESTGQHLLSCNNNGSVSITDNLYEALKWLRYKLLRRAPPSRGQEDVDMIKWMWIDAICINQKDLEERRTQVLMMRQIYEQATETIIWLGNVNKQAISLIETLDSARRACSAAKETRDFSAMSSEERVCYGIPNPTQPSVWECFARLDEFLSSGWFSRIWVVQELAVSRHPVMVAEESDFELSWDDFVAVICFLQQLSMPMWILDETHTHALASIRELFQQGDPLALLALLVRTSRFSASDPRDKVYAILGISAGVGSDIQPEYTITVERLYTAVARRLLPLACEETYLDILGVPRLTEDEMQCRSSRSDAARPRLPSWVPNWYDEISTIQNPLFPSVFAWMPLNFGTGIGFFAFHENFAASPQVGCHGDETYPCIDGPFLRLGGFKLSQITTIGLLHEFVQRASGYKAKMQAMGNEAAAWRSGAHLCNVASRFGKPYPHTGENMRDVWWQTICAGQNMVSHAETKAGFEKWFAHVYKHFRFIPAPRHPLLVRINTYWGYWLTDAGKKKPPLRASDDYRHFTNATVNATSGRRMFRTKDECVGLGPPDMKKGNSVFLIKGCRTPMILRRAEQPEHWTLVGACYLHGFMNGEGYKEERCGDVWLA